ncbi:MAG TPA: flagellar hook basal-body protein [Planctomicrobium sp.]|nr:flagellar hook basal-body protein [Planctomicrobium sp.]
MINGLYSAGTAMESSVRQHELIAQNLANAQMPGYRRQSIRHASMEHHFDDDLRNAVQFQAMGTSSQEIMTDFSSGVMEKTGHPFDVAIEGNGFFVIDGPSGPLYTRNGVFQVDSEGRIVTADNLPVQGKGGDITIPADTSTASIHIDGEGRVFAGNMEIGQLDIVSFADPNRLTRSGATLFEAPADMRPQESDAQILQGSRERANVTPVQELVEMIAAQRRQEAAQKSMSLLIESLGKHINVQGRA